MIRFLLDYQILFNIVLLHMGLALSQYIVLRAGVFSLATAGLTSIGAYTAALLALRLELHPVFGLLGGMLAGLLMAFLLSLPLSRLRGVFQAIATLAFGQIVLSLTTYATPITGGAFGINGIPKVVETWHLALFIGVSVYLIWSLNRSSVGRAFDAIQQDEMVAVSLGIRINKFHTMAFLLSGAIAGTTGALLAYHNHTIVPEEFGFGMLVAALSYVVLGGHKSILGPLIGAAFLTLLPELARPLADNRTVIYGAMLIVVMIFMPEGVVDTAVNRLRAYHRRATREESTKAGVAENAA